MATLNIFFNELPFLIGDLSVLNSVREKNLNKKSLDAVNYLENIYNILKELGFEQYVSFDLGVIGSMDYYTGIIFHAYTFGTGEPVVNGGRYDKLLGQFGCDKASIGFSITIDRLIAALNRQNIHIPHDANGTLLVYNADRLGDAINVSKKLRSTGVNVCMIEYKAASLILNILNMLKNLH